ncbi:hypothetical protein FRC07_001486 [Ceratobasidium sp. 392]|nr:hypothetical protein FRC07_001486 [Ceratobasidium sp. 392]
MAYARDTRAVADDDAYIVRHVIFLFVGLVLYLWDINVTVAWVVTVVTLSALCFYLATTLIPVWVLFCPYKTAQSAYTKDMLNLLMTLPKAFVKILVKIWTGSTQAARRIQSQDFDPLNPVIWGRFFQAMLFRNPTQVPTNQENSAQATNQTRPGRLRSLVQVVNRWFSDRFSSLLNGTHQPDLESGPQHHLPAAGSDEEVEPDQFVKDALEWLIFNSQNSDSIDTAIGALAISKVPFDDRDLSDRINSHLVKHFSDCFSSSENGTKLQILPHQKAFKSALDYIDWMSYFAGGKIESISAQTATFIEILGGETVTNLGLAFASLAGHKNLHTAASRNVALWLASLIRCYDQGVLYLNEEVLSVYVDGLTVVGRGVRGSNASDRAQVLVVPNLINILWKVSHIDGSILRFSIALNLAAFALTTELPYPGSKRSFESAAGHLANYDYRSPSNQLTNFHSLVVFALLGFIHPRSNLGLNEEIVEISHKIIHETKYLEQSSSLSMSIPQLVELDPLRRHLTSMLIESMLPNAGTAFATRRYLFYTAFGDAIDVGQWENRTYKAVMPGVCQLIQDHLDGSLKLHDDAIVAATDLLLREVQELGGNLDFKIIIPNGPDEDESELPTRSLQGDIPAADDTERMPSVVLTRIMQESEHKKCVETAARAIMFHIHECRPELVMAATRWFATAFDVFGHVEAHVNDSRSQPQMCGYMRILAAMVIHCTDPTGLTNRLLGVNETNSDTRLHEAVENTCRLLTEAITDDTHLHAFSISSLTVWRFACLDETFSMDKIGQTLKEAWSLIAKHVECDLHTEALGALLDTIALLTAVTDPSIVISDTEARTLLRLLSQLRPETERLRPNLAVALAFCGLCLDASGWDFWTLNQRKESWRNYHRKPGTRTQDTSALLLLGLSRLLAHSQALMLDHTSIETITSEIDRYMQQHAKNPTKRLTLPFLPRFDVRRHVRESVWKYLQATESHAPFTKSMTASRVKLRTAVQYDGGEGFLYEAPQPFARTRSGMEF